MASKNWKVGIVGYGSSAKIFHIPFIQALPEYTLHAIVQRTPRVGNDAAKEHPDVKCFPCLDEMLKETTVDMIVISTPVESHYSLTKSALFAQKHVLCEKPFTLTANEADELIALANQQHRLLSVFHNRRWDADFVTLKQLLVSRTLGLVTNYETCFEFSDPRRSVQNSADPMNTVSQIKAIYDLGTHLLDQAIHIFGLPQRVTGHLGAELKGNDSSECSNIFTVLMHYDNGLLVTAKAGTISSKEKPLRFLVTGDKGGFKKFYFDIQKEHLLAGKSPRDNGFGEEPLERYGVLATKESGGSAIEKSIATVEPPTWAEYYRKLARALSGREPVPVSGSEARDIIQIIELAIISSQLKETVEIP